MLNIHIHIRRARLPFLYQTSSKSPPIHERVTVITKTFERYDEVNRLIDSVFKFYPSMTILVADDSVHFQTIEKKNVLQYKMPPLAGWFAGRNLVASQVATEYLLWTDDDFIFTARTKLEVFMEILDKQELKLDVVGGMMGKTPFCSSCIEVSKDREGQCIGVIDKCNRGQLEGFPHCVLTDRTMNIFIARTRSIQEAGFDPNRNLRHVGHPEVFMDGYHTLKSACCWDLGVDHLRGGSAFYQKHRTMRVDDQELKERRQFHSFKYNVKCFDV